MQKRCLRAKEPSQDLDVSEITITITITYTIELDQSWDIRHAGDIQAGSQQQKWVRATKPRVRVDGRAYVPLSAPSDTGRPVSLSVVKTSNFMGKRYAGKVTIVSSLRLAIFFLCSAEVGITERCSIDDFDSGRVGGSHQFRDGTYVQAAVPWLNRFLSLYLSQRLSPAFASNQSSRSAALRTD
jgi:hypothetical protein